MPAQPILGQVTLFAGNFAIRGWALCNGQILSIAQNTALFSLLGTTYGGNGTSNFALPNFQGRVPVHAGQGPGLSPYVLGQTAGTSTVTLLTTQIPSHSHLPQAQPTATAGSESASPASAVWSVSGSRRSKTNLYSTTGTAVAMQPLAAVGGGQPHNNMAPYLSVTFLIALQGIYPARN